MVIIGAKGMAKGLLVAMDWDGTKSDCYLFDNLTPNMPDILYDRYKVIKSWNDLQKHFAQISSDFILGVGGQKARKYCAETAISLGGRLCSYISKHALIGTLGVNIARGVCVLPNVTITADITIGEGTLINRAVSISHDSKIGCYCDLAPGVQILGRVTIGDRTEIGSNAVILPDVVVGSDCRIGAGAVVTKDVPDGVTVVGVPAKPLIKKDS